MRYLLLIANHPERWDPPTDAPCRSAAYDGVIDDWATYTRALHEAGVLLAGDALYGPDTATTVQVRAGQVLLSDGPFADTEEHLIGYYLIDVPDLDHALSWAARVPNVRTGSVEVRPVTAGSSTVEVLASGAAPDPSTDRSPA